MKDRRIERRDIHEVERERRAVGPATTNVNVGPDGTTNVQEQETVEEVGGELEDVSRRETIVERRTR